MNDRFLCFLGIAKKSGNLVFGMDAVKKECSNLYSVLVASDISENSLNEITEFLMKSGKGKPLKLEYGKDDIERATNKYAAVIGVSDINICEKIKSLVQTKTERNDAYNDKV